MMSESNCLRETIRQNNSIPNLTEPNFLIESYLLAQKTQIPILMQNVQTKP